MQKNNKIKIVTLLTVILIIGVYMVFSSSKIWAAFIYNDAAYYFKRQLIFLVLGIVMLIVGSKLNLASIRKFTNAILIISLLLLVLVLIPGVGVSRNGSRSWFGIGEFLFQPSELFKLCIVIYMSDKLSKNYLQTKKFFRVVIPILIPALLGFGLIMLQPDLGSGIVMLLAVVIMCMVTKSKFKNYLVIGCVGLVGFALLIVSATYRIDRIEAFINPFNDPLGSGFQSIQSLYAISPGGLLGRGIDNSYQKYFYLPEPQTDFIFAIFAEEFGFIGGALLILAYIFLIDYCFKRAMNSQSEYGSFLKVGFTSLIAVQVFINLGVVVGLLPVTGITLPFMSYGGSSLTILLFSMGLILNDRTEENDENFISG